jgi:hypothetical protein
MRNNFIQLTLNWTTEGASPTVWINMDQVMYMSEYYVNGNTTAIYLQDKSTLYVKETPIQILQSNKIENDIPWDWNAPDIFDLDSMEENDWDKVMNRIDNEGFHYCFKNYSNWEEIKDEKFHKLRLAYLKAAEDLNTYISDK